MKSGPDLAIVIVVIIKLSSAQKTLHNLSCPIVQRDRKSTQKARKAKRAACAIVCIYVRWLANRNLHQCSDGAGYQYHQR